MIENWYKQRSQLQIFLLTLLFSASAFSDSEKLNSPLIVYLPESPPMEEARNHYNEDIIRLALEKTQSQYGAYEIKFIPYAVRETLARYFMTNSPKNLFLERSFNDDDTQFNVATYVHFPHDLGLLGYRVCFTNQTIKAQLAEHHQIDDIKKLKIGVGEGWTDGAILEKSGFKVSIPQKQDNLFLLTAAGRIDLFCRGANEFFTDYKHNQGLEGLTYDETFAIFYPFPRFLFTHKDNTLATKRIEEGLKLAFSDGSLKTLWLKHYGESLNFIKLNNRAIFRIPNPLIQTLTDTYSQYYVDPTKL